MHACTCTCTCVFVEFLCRVSDHPSCLTLWSTPVLRFGATLPLGVKDVGRETQEEKEGEKRGNEEEEEVEEETVCLD